MECHGKYLMGIDNGLTLSKVAIFDLAGRTIRVASRKIEVQYPKPGYTERDMDVVWQKTAEAIHEVMEASGITPDDILAVGNSGHGNGLYMLDRDGKAFRPSIASMDGRGADIMDEWNRPGGVHDQAFPYIQQACWAGAAARSAGLAETSRAGELSQDRQSHDVHGLHQILPDRRAHHRLLDHQRQQPVRFAQSGLFARAAGDLRHPRDAARAAAAGVGARDRRPCDAGSRAAHRAGRGHTGHRRPVRHRCRGHRLRGDQRWRPLHRRGHVEHQRSRHQRSDHRQAALPMLAVTRCRACG